MENESAGVPGLVVVFPTFDAPFDHYPNRWLHELVVTSAHENGLAAVDLLACLAAYDLADIRVDPSPLGHRGAAHAIVRAAMESRLLPGHDDAGLPGDCSDYRPQDFETVRGY